MSKHTKSIVPPLSMIYRKIAISFVVLTVLLVGIIVFFSLAKGTVVITPKQELKSAEFLITVKEGSATSSGTISGKYEERTVEAEGQFEATKVQARSGRATGRIVISNTTGVPQPLVATTRLLSPESVLLRMKNSATVPAKGSVAVEVYADQPGPAGDIGPTRFTIPGLNAAKQKVIYGESKESMQGGSGQVRVVSKEDLERARTEVTEKAVNMAQSEFAKTPAAALGGIISQVEVLEVTGEAKVGQERPNFPMRAKVRVTLLAYDTAALEKLALEKVLANIPADRELLKFHKEAMIIRLKNINKAAKEAQLSVYADGEVRLNAASSLLDPVKIAGMLPEEAEQYLKSFEAIEEVEVKLFPSWQKRIPTIPDRIKIVIKK